VLLHRAVGGLRKNPETGHPEILTSLCAGNAHLRHNGTGRAMRCEERQLAEQRYSAKVRYMEFGQKKVVGKICNAVLYPLQESLSGKQTITLCDAIGRTRPKPVLLAEVLEQLIYRECGPEVAIMPEPSDKIGPPGYKC